MSRFPLFAFATLVTATVAAFFITQHLKVTTPLLAGFPRPYPQFIDPRSGGPCYDPATGKAIDNRVMSISFYLLHHSDNVDVWVVDPAGRIVATLATNRFMPGGSHPLRSQFVWNGRQADGSFAPDGRYYVRVHLIHQGRTVTISGNGGPLPLFVRTVPPKPVITSISPLVVSAARPTPVRIAYTGNENRAGTILIYRLSAGRKSLVGTFLTPWSGHSTTWNGRIAGHAAPPGTYLIGLKVTDATCKTGSFPPSAALAVVVQS